MGFDLRSVLRVKVRDGVGDGIRVRVEMGLVRVVVGVDV